MEHNFGVFFVSTFLYFLSLGLLQTECRVCPDWAMTRRSDEAGRGLDGLDEDQHEDQHGLDEDQREDQHGLDEDQHPPAPQLRGARCSSEGGACCQQVTILSLACHT